jgi:hypothetical protein
MSLRTVAELTRIGSAAATCRLPTGRPLEMYCRTTSRSTLRLLESSVTIVTTPCGGRAWQP